MCRQQNDNFCVSRSNMCGWLLAGLHVSSSAAPGVLKLPVACCLLQKTCCAHRLACEQPCF
jgi:hypothetical protein